MLFDIADNLEEKKLFRFAEQLQKKNFINSSILHAGQPLKMPIL